MISLGYLDIALFALSIIFSVIIGLFFANKNETVEDFMLGGRKQPLLPVGLSLMTSFVSGLTIIGTPAELYYHGSGYATCIIGILLWVPISVFISLPVFYRLGNISIYNYLEKRYHISVKRLVTLAFMITITMYNSVVLYIPSLSLQSIFGLSELISVGLIGASCLLYSTAGGIKAVIWTDFFQAGIMYFSVLSIIYVGTIKSGGIKELFSTAIEGHRISFTGYLDLDLHTRHTIYTVTAGITLVNLVMNGCNQIQVQRSLTLPTLRMAQMSHLLAGLFTMVISLLSSYVGLILFSTYKHCDPYEDHQIDKRDSIVIYYVGNNFADIPGLRGVFIASIFAATLSTLSSFQNSMSALLLEDIVKPLISPNKTIDPKTELKLSKFFSFIFGVACVGLSFVVSRMGGLLQAAITLFGAAGVPMLVPFYLGMTTRFVNTAGVLCGLISSFAFGAYIQIYQTLYLPPLEPSLVMSTDMCTRNTNISNQVLFTTANNRMSRDDLTADLDQIGSMSYLWIPTFGLILSVSVSMVVSLLTGGWNQQINDDYLVSWLKDDKTKYKCNDNGVSERFERQQHQQAKEEPSGSFKCITGAYE